MSLISNASMTLILVDSLIENDMSVDISTFRIEGVIGRENQFEQEIEIRP
jgi:hypothetical protein